MKVKVEEIANHQKGFAFKSKDFRGDGFPVVKVKDFTSNSIDDSSLVSVNHEVAKKNKNVSLEKEDIVIATVGSGPNNPNSLVGKTVRVPKELEGALLNQNAVIIRVKNKSIYDKRFLYYAFKSDRFSKYLVSGSQGSANQASITLKDIYSYEVEWPDKDIRKNIGNFLFLLDQKIVLNNRLNEKLEKMSQTIFKSWFVDFDPVHAKKLALEKGLTPAQAERAAMAIISGVCSPSDFAENFEEMDKKITAKLSKMNKDKQEELSHTAFLFPSKFEDSEFGEIPKGWKIEELINIAKLDSSSIKPGASRLEEFYHYSIPAYDKGYLPTIDQGVAIKSNKYIVNKDSVLVSKLNPDTRRIWYHDIKVDKKSICSTEFMQFVPKNKHHRAFLWGLLSSEPFQVEIMKTVTGSTGSRQRAQPKQLERCNVLNPNNELKDLYSNFSSLLLSKSSHNLYESLALEKLRDTLLPRLLAGKIDLSKINIASDL